VVVSDDVIPQIPVVVFENLPLPSHRGTALLDYRFAKNEGGKILGGMGINAIFSFDNGHNYTKIAEPLNLGQANAWNVGMRATTDPRLASQLETARTHRIYKSILVSVKLLLSLERMWKFIFMR
jgi:hypothetical protein